MAKKNPKELLTYGHWDVSYVGDFNPNEHLAFVYLIKLSDGKRYIGVKRLWTNIKQPPSFFKRKTKKPFKEHKWRSYNSSSNILKLYDECDITGRYILGLYDKWGVALMAEFIWQQQLDVCRSDEYLNYRMGGDFTKNTYPPAEIYDTIKKYLDNK